MQQETAGEVFDLVVVGSGGGSLCAAIAARKASLSALILEKTPFVGGTTAKSGGIMWIPNNRFMKADGIEDSTEKAMTYLDHVVGITMTRPAPAESAASPMSPMRPRWWISWFQRASS